MDIDKQIKLRDGRTLAFNEHGDFSGKPVFFIHGNPGSRLLRHPDENIAKNLGVRIIAPDRPGYGLSDFQKNRRLLDFPDDMAQLADALNIDKFAIFGVSAGGPCVASCAYKLPNRITQAAIVSGPSPVNREGAYDGMGSSWRMSFKMAEKLPLKLLRPLIWIQRQLLSRNPEQALANFAKMLSPSDQEMLSRPYIINFLLSRQDEATRQGVKGMVHEAKILVSPWGFRPDDIKVGVHLWFWEDDYAIPMQMGHYLAARIPHNQTHFFKGGGHMSFFDHWGNIIEALISEKQLTG
jgi:pimeloyl-ACP methyl ester carboxylesterase